MGDNYISCKEANGSIIPYCRRRIEYEPDLLLKGLAILYQKNAKHKK